MSDYSVTIPAGKEVAYFVNGKLMTPGELMELDEPIVVPSVFAVPPTPAPAPATPQETPPDSHPARRSEP